MGFQLSAAGEAKWLTNTLVAENLTLKLFTACATAGGSPTPASVVGDMTEATFTGYASKTLTNTIGASTWSTPSGSPATSSYGSSPQTWTNTGGTPQTILGYYYVGASSGTFYGAEAWQYSNVINPSGSLSFTPQFKQGCNPAPTS